MNDKLFESILSYSDFDGISENELVEPLEEEDSLDQLCEKIYYECRLKPLFEQVYREAHLREMANLASQAMTEFINEFYYEFAHTINFRKQNAVPFDPRNFPVREIIKKTYESACGDEFLTLIEPPEEDQWLQQVINLLREKQNNVSNYHRQQYTGLIDYIETNDILRIILDEVRMEHQQRSRQA